MQAFVRHGDILGELFLPDPGQTNGVGIVWCPGLPNAPTAEDMAQPLADRGFAVLKARYPGNWQSYGHFGPSTSVDGAVRGIELLSPGRAVDLTTEREIVWSLNRRTLVGNSYGGGVAVCALALSDLADRAVAFCPLLEPDRQTADPAQAEDDLTSLYSYLRRCYENIFRGLDDREWTEFLDGRSRFYPPTYIPALKNRPLFLIRGTNDAPIRPYHTKAFYERLVAQRAEKAEIIVVDGTGHGRAFRAITWDRRTRWLLS